MTKPDLLYLIGFRGSGKTTVGRLLAGKLGWQFLDSDDEIELQTGWGIAEVFAREGEQGFRRRESQLMAELATRHRTVIACGGGVILDSTNRELIRTTGNCIWLKADVRTVVQRLRNDPGGERRPPLTELPFDQEIERLITEREPLYRATAHATVDTNGQSPDAIVSAILSAWTNSLTSFP